MGCFISNSKGAFSWADGGKREKVIFNPAVSKLTTNRTLGDTTGKRERSPSMKRRRNVGQAGPGTKPREEAAIQVKSQAA